MKLFRHHSEKFENSIENSNSFNTDKSRDFNCSGKNRAEFYFYAISKAGAEMYAIDDTCDDCFEEDFTKLFTYESDAKLLDLRVVENRRLLKNTVTAISKSIEKLYNSCVKDHGKDFADNCDFYWSNEDVINDERNSYRSLWGQNATDYKIGIVLKNEIISLGYDGVIIQDGKSIEVALISKAKKI